MIRKLFLLAMPGLVAFAQATPPADEKLLAGFEDGLANEDQGAGGPTLAGLEAAKAAGWKPAGAAKPAKSAAKKGAAK